MGQREPGVTTVHSPLRSDLATASSVPAMKPSPLAEQRPPRRYERKPPRLCRRGSAAAETMLGEQLTHRPQCVVQQRDQLPEQLLFALMEGAHLGPERLGALCSLALGLGVKRPFQQRLRPARRQVRGERVSSEGAFSAQRANGSVRDAQGRTRGPAAVRGAQSRRNGMAGSSWLVHDCGALAR
jgi:hypothetical protein